MKPKTTTITQKIILQASPEEVYNALLDSRKHSEFTGSKATGKAEVGLNLLRGTGIFQVKTLSLKKAN